MWKMSRKKAFRDTEIKRDQYIGGILFGENISSLYSITGP